VAVQSALIERVIPIGPSPQWLAAHPEAQQTFRALMALPLPAYAPLYVSWCLRRGVGAYLARADQVLQDALGDRVLPARVRDNLLVVVFGMCQCLGFGADRDLTLPSPLDMPAMLEPLLEQLCASDGSTRTAADILLEHLATLAELGRLQRETHYALTREGHVALRLDLCLAAFRHYVQQTKLETEVLSAASYLRQLRENAEAKGYVQGTSQRIYFGKVRKRAVIIVRVLAEQAGLNLEGFPHDNAAS
jgi:hypothetical protein